MFIQAFAISILFSQVCAISPEDVARPTSESYQYVGLLGASKDIDLKCSGVTGEHPTWYFTSVKKPVVPSKGVNVELRDVIAYSGAVSLGKGDLYDVKTDNLARLSILSLRTVDMNTAGRYRCVFTSQKDRTVTSTCVFEVIYIVTEPQCTQPPAYQVDLDTNRFQCVLQAYGSWLPNINWYTDADSRLTTRVVESWNQTHYFIKDQFHEDTRPTQFSARLNFAPPPDFAKNIALYTEHPATISFSWRSIIYPRKFQLGVEDLQTTEPSSPDPETTTGENGLFIAGVAREEPLDSNEAEGAFNISNILLMVISGLFLTTIIASSVMITVRRSSRKRRKKKQENEGKSQDETSDTSESEDDMASDKPSAVVKKLVQPVETVEKEISVVAISLENLKSTANERNTSDLEKQTSLRIMPTDESIPEVEETNRDPSSRAARKPRDRIRRLSSRLSHDLGLPLKKSFHYVTAKNSLADSLRKRYMSRRDSRSVRSDPKKSAVQRRGPPGSSQRPSEPRPPSYSYRDDRSRQHHSRQRQGSPRPPSDWDRRRSRPDHGNFPSQRRSPHTSRQPGSHQHGPPSHYRGSQNGSYAREGSSRQRWSHMDHRNHRLKEYSWANP